MDLFIAVHEDRHIDVGIYAFSHETEAIAWANKTAKELDRHGFMDEIAAEESKTGNPHPEWGLTSAMRKAGWVHRVVYGVEGDGVVVRRVVLDYESRGVR